MAVVNHDVEHIEASDTSFINPQMPDRFTNESRACEGRLSERSNVMNDVVTDVAGDYDGPTDVEEIGKNMEEQQENPTELVSNIIEKDHHRLAGPQRLLRRTDAAKIMIQAQNDCGLNHIRLQTQKDLYEYLETTCQLFTLIIADAAVRTRDKKKWETVERFVHIARSEGFAANADLYTDWCAYGLM